VEPGYERVLDVLIAALDQTQSGKGKERHASDDPFLEQEIMNGARCCGLGAMVFQVRKKALEAERLAYKGQFQRAKTDALGSIIYDVALYLRIEEMEEEGAQESEKEETDRTDAGAFTAGYYAGLNAAANSTEEIPPIIKYEQWKFG